ncbi:ring-cleaving dioxygenase [Salipiger sp. IMCC34102]|uniref:VOC family protein n=1 Tax=Salipiger sp. IMCC34102 TaxID=2510647 RepID=UPI00101BFE7F|nr:VOC family protein [Salipiger sp. IMCC34102]RYH03937.1 ring-cleaving dioxygenase [Salipiger sp. IMCC34102]
MLTQIKGLHHVTSIASDPARNNAFFTDTLGLRRVKTTVNFDAPDVYHLYYGDEVGTPGTVMTHFPFPGAARGRTGTGEVGETLFAVPPGTLDNWSDRLAGRAKDLDRDTRFGEQRLTFRSNDNEAFALVESEDARVPWTGNGVDEDHAIRGFRGATLRLADTGAMAELLGFMGYQKAETRDGVTRYLIEGGNPADAIDLSQADAAPARQGAGSVHHIAFAVEDRAAQLEVRRALTDTGYAVTPVIDRDYFWAIYFRTPGGVLFEVATNEPGFDRDEDTAHLGEALKLPTQHEHLRQQLQQHLQPLDA